MAFHLAGGKPGPVAKAGTTARGRAPRSQGDTVTSPASGAGSAPDPPDYAPIPQSAPGPPSVTGRAASPAATADGGSRRLGLALLVIATAQLMVVLDATIVNVALPHVQSALGFSGSGLEWVVNAYAVTFGGLLLIGGRGGARAGRIAPPAGPRRRGRGGHGHRRRRAGGLRPVPALHRGRPGIAL